MLSSYIHTHLWRITVDESLPSSCLNFKQMIRVVNMSQTEGRQRVMEPSRRLHSRKRFYSWVERNLDTRFGVTMRMASFCKEATGDDLSWWSCLWKENEERLELQYLRKYCQDFWRGWIRRQMDVSVRRENALESQDPIVITLSSTYYTHTEPRKGPRHWISTPQYRTLPESSDCIQSRTPLELPLHPLNCLAKAPTTIAAFLPPALTTVHGIRQPVVQA